MRLAAALIDFNGTLAHDGRLIDAVAERLQALAARLELRVVTGDTTGTARQELAKLPVSVHIVPAHQQEAAGCAVIEAMNASETVVIGNDASLA